jgi:predicted PurR-regulated permease PerM
MTKQVQIYTYFLLGILAVSLYFAFQVLSPFINNIAMAIILASLLHPVHKRLRRRLGGSRTLAALCTTVLVTLLIIIPLFLFTGALVGQAATSITALQAWLKATNLESWFTGDTFAPYIHWVQQTFPWLQFDAGSLDVKGGLLELSKNLGQLTIDLGTRVLGNFIGVLLNFLILLFVLFFLLRDGEAMLAQLKKFSPLHDDQEDRILNRMHDVALSVMAGSFLVAICQGVVGGIGLAIVGIPALFWGAMMGFASLVPVVGTMLIWGPAALYLLIVGNWKEALFITGWGAVIVSSIDSVLRPLLMKGQAKMSTFWVFLSIIGGINYFGPLGILYGPMILALAMVMLSIYADEYSEPLSDKHNATGEKQGDGTSPVC